MDKTEENWSQSFFILFFLWLDKREFGELPL